MLTPKKYAEQVGAAYSTVMSWLQRNLILGAERQELPSGGWYYVIPADAPKPELKPGPKPKTTGATAKRKTAQKPREGKQ